MTPPDATPTGASAEGAAVREASMDGELTIFHAATWRQWLDEQVGGAGELRVRLDQVTEIDTAGAQLLLMGKRLAQQRGGVLSYVGHSPAVLTLLELFDLGAQLGDPIVLPAAPARKVQE